MNQKTTCVSPELCSCGRLYKDRKDERGNTMCSACYNNCSIDTLKMLWSAPIETCWPAYRMPSYLAEARWAKYQENLIHSKYIQRLEEENGRDSTRTA